MHRNPPPPPAPPPPRRVVDSGPPPLPLLLILALALVALLATGCGYNMAVIRVVEYSGGGVVAPITGQAAGIAVHQAGAEHSFADVTIIYQGERAAVRVSAEREAAQ